jgi:hypothetical protein
VKKILGLFVGLCVLLTGLPALAQQDGPPPLLVIYREELKPGRAAAHEKTEAEWPRAFAKANFPNHYLAMTSLSGGSEVWFLEGHSGLAGVEKGEAFMQQNAALRAEIGQIAQQDGEHLSGFRVIAANYRSDLSYRPGGANIPRMRYFYVTAVRIRPGHEQAYVEANRIVREAHEKANIDEHWAVFQVTMGVPAGTYLIFQPMKSLAEVDAFAQTHGQAFQDALGEAGRNRLGELTRAAVLSTETNIFAFNPAMSYPSPNMIAGDPEFWTPKPAMEAAPKPAEKKKR